MTDEFGFDAIEPGDLFDKPDVNDWLYDYDPRWEDAFEAMPPGFTDGQIESVIEILWDLDVDEWPDFLDDDFDFWEWYNENYG